MQHREVTERGARHSNYDNECTDAANLYEHVAKHGSEDGTRIRHSRISQRKASLFSAMLTEPQILHLLVLFRTFERL